MSIVEGGSPFEEGWLFGERRLFEEQQPEKKRQGEGFEHDEGEGEPKRQKVEDEDEDDDDPDLYEVDSEFGPEDYKIGEFESAFKTIESGIFDDQTTPPLQDEDEEDRNCIKVPICNKYQHASKFCGLPVFELFRVELRLNENLHNNSSFEEGPLYGAIELVASPENPNRTSYYWVRKQDADSITINSGKSVVLPLSTPKPRPPIADCYYLHLNFAFKFKNEDVFEFEPGCLHENPQLFDDDHGNHTATSRVLSLSPFYIPWGREYGPWIRRYLFGNPNCDRFLVAAYFSAYEGAWAAVDVKILKKGVRSFYGFIYARLCIFYTRIRLLSIQSDEKRELQAFRSVELTRSVVAVPSYSSLIIAAILYDQHGNLIVRGKTFFPASPNGRAEKLIGGDGVRIEVKWACEP